MPSVANILSYTATSFMGAKLRSFSVNLAWNLGGPSQLACQLVDDPVFGAAFSPPGLGTPVHFSCGGLTFNGLLQKWERRQDTSGNPVYDAVVVDPREILDGAQVVIGGFGGSVGAVKNLFNAYGHWEGQGYGASQSTDAGMPWVKIRDAVLALCNSPVRTDNGGPLTFRGATYGLDLSQVPTPDSSYRLGGASIGLLEAVSQICEDGGCDFFVELVGSTIRIRTVARGSQPALGTISATVSANGTNVARSSSGLECRNELTSAFLVGGSVTTLWQTDAIRQFWGYDIDGAPILGSQIVIRSKNAKGVVIATATTEQMDLNASPVADIIAGVRYRCTTAEMRFAQVNFNSWAMFVRFNNPALAAAIKLIDPFIVNAPGGRGGLLGGALGNFGPRPNWVNDLKVQVQLAVDADAHDRCLRLYEFVRGYADEYMGRKFLVGLPFILAKTDPETLKITTSWEVTDSGYQADGAPPLGLSVLNQDILTGQDGRFRAFVVFNRLVSADLSKVSPHGSVIENGLLYQECQVDPQIISAGGPCVVMSVAGPLLDREVKSQFGDPNLLGVVLQKTPADASAILKKCVLPIKVAPACRTPVAVAVPLLSTTLSYGPWYAAGAPGKVRYESDPSLTPWAYGGYAAMNLAGTARVATAVTSMQISETGTVELVGLPTTGLGDALQANGPNVTGIDVAFSSDGATTTYRFATYTQKYGVFSKGAVDRLRRLSLAGVELRKSIRTGLKEQAEKGRVIGEATRAANAWRKNLPKAIKKETPQDVLTAFVELDLDSGDVRTNPGLTTMEEVVAISNGDDDDAFRQTATMSIGGLVRPFATNPDTSSVMAKYTTPSIDGDIPSKNTLDPWKGVNDVEAFGYGQTYDGMHALRRNVSGSDARLLGLRSPLVLVGWGYDTDTNQVPGTDGVWDANLLTRQDTHKAGPMDPLWDDRRGVWTCHATLKGNVNNGGIEAKEAGIVHVKCLDGSTYDLGVENWFSQAAGSGAPVLIGYVPTDNKWHILSQGPGSGESPLTTKGDVYTHDDSVDTRLPVGYDGQILVADSASTTGLKWQYLSTPPGPGPYPDPNPILSSYSWKIPVRVATVKFGFMISDFHAGCIVDGVTLDVDDRILIKDNNDSFDNGIYYVNATGVPTRASDMNIGDYKSIAGATVAVLEGMSNNTTIWLCQATDVFGQWFLSWSLVGPNRTHEEWTQGEGGESVVPEVWANTGRKILISGAGKYLIWANVSLNAKLDSNGPGRVLVRLIDNVTGVPQTTEYLGVCCQVSGVWCQGSTAIHETVVVGGVHPSGEFEVQVKQKASGPYPSLVTPSWYVGVVDGIDDLVGTPPSPTTPAVFGYMRIG